QHDGSGGRRLTVRIRQPGMQREDRNFDREGQEKCEEERKLLGAGKAQPAGLQHRHDGCVVEGAGARVQINHRGQHQHGAGHREQEKFYGGVDAALMAPDADQEIHRDQRYFPEHIKEEKIEGTEDAHESKFEQQEKREELFHAAVDAAPRDENANGRKKRGENDQPQAEAVERDVIANRRTVDPRYVRFEHICAGASKPEWRNESERSNESQERDDQCEHANRAGPLLRDEQRQDESDQRQEEDGIEEIHYRAPPMMPIAIRTRTEPSTTQVA